MNNKEKIQKNLIKFYKIPQGLLVKEIFSKNRLRYFQNKELKLN